VAETRTYLWSGNLEAEAPPVDNPERDSKEVPE